MNKLIEVILKTRIKLLASIADLSAEQLNYIPEGFNNNIIWHLGHLVSAQQGLCYLQANLPMRVTDAIRNDYAPGTKPERIIAQEEIDDIKSLLITTMEQLESDVNRNYFAGYTPWVNRFDVELNTVDDVLCYLPYHDGLHADRIAAYKRIILSV